METLRTIPEIIAAARQNLSRNVWDYAAGGAESEATLRRNRAAICRHALLPRVLRDVNPRSTRTTCLGLPLALPVMLAPIGAMSWFHPDGAVAAARAAGAAGTICWVSTATNPDLETVAAAATGPLIFQLYVRGDREWMASMVRRVEAAGYAALCVTVDIPVYGRRERDIHNRFLPRQPWSNLRGREPEPRYQSGLTWDDIAWLRQTTRLPLILKGILAPEDATLAVDHGVAAVVVSNHGGRQLDHAPGTLDVLPAVAAAVAGRAEVLVDGGILRGTDVLKAIALGARAVLIGKLQCWALGAGGEAGVARVLALLQAEIDNAMGNLGVCQLAELGPAYLYPDPTPLVPTGDPEVLGL